LIPYDMAGWSVIKPIGGALFTAEKKPSTTKKEEK
jgi:hypothetical protein